MKAFGLTKFVLLCLGLLTIVPLVVNVDDSFFAYYLYVSFCYITLSQGWNIGSAYTGQVSMASHLFFAIGAYTTGLLWVYDVTKSWYYFDPLVMILSGTVAAVAAMLLGIPLLYRLKGDFFAFGTLAAAEIIKTIIRRWASFTGGARGFRLPGEGFASMLPHYLVALLTAFISTLIALIILKSRVGLILRALSEDELSASVRGINTLLFKVIAFGIGAFLIGIGGSLFAYYIFVISPMTVMNLNWMFIPILVCILGGKGTVEGPVVGSFVVGAIYTYIEIFVGPIHPMVSGALLILIMKTMPEGLIGVITKKM